MLIDSSVDPHSSGPSLFFGGFGLGGIGRPRAVGPPFLEGPMPWRSGALLGWGMGPDDDYEYDEDLGDLVQHWL